MALQLSTSGLRSHRTTKTPHPNNLTYHPDSSPIHHKLATPFSAHDHRSRSPRRRQNMPGSRQPLVLPNVSQIPLPPRLRSSTPRRTNKPLNLTSNRNLPRTISQPRLSFDRHPSPSGDHVLIADSAPHRRSSSSTECEKDDVSSHIREAFRLVAGNDRLTRGLSIWRTHEEDEEDIRNRSRNTSRAEEAWNMLLNRPTPPSSFKGKERAVPRLGEQPSSFDSTHVVPAVSLHRSREHSLTVDDSSSQRPSPVWRPLHLRSQSLSPYSTSSASLSDSSSTTSRSSSSSTISSATTAVTDPDLYLSPPTGHACRTPLRGRLATFQLAPSPSPSPPKPTSLLPPQARGASPALILKVPRGRDPLTKSLRNGGGFYLDCVTEVPADAPYSQLTRPTTSKSRLASLLDMALAFSFPSSGKIMLDSYAPPTSRHNSPNPPVATRTPSTDSLGLDIPSISQLKRPRHSRRESVASLEGPIVYHHHAKPPRKQAVKQAFGPCDIKPYGYRVGVREVRGVFGVFITSEDDVDELRPRSHLHRDKSKGSSPSFLDLMLGVGAVEEDAMYAGLASGRVGRGSATTFGSSLPAKSKPATKRTAHDPPSTVALQRYPIIPYNPPPGGAVKAEDEVFPKIRRTAFWWKDMVPGADDGRIDGTVQVSGALRQRSPSVNNAGRGRGMMTEQRLSRGDRSPSPHRGRKRCVTVRPSLLASSSAAKAPSTLESPISKTIGLPIPIPAFKITPTTVMPRSLSSKYFRPPPQPVELASVYLIWSLKGTVNNAVRYGTSTSESWPGVQRSPTPLPSRRRVSKKGSVDGKEGRSAKGVHALGRRSGPTRTNDTRPHACGVASMLRWEYQPLEEVEGGGGHDADREDNDILGQPFGVDCDEDSEHDSASD